MVDPIEYRLPLTVVRIHGTRNTTTTSLDATAPPRVECDSTIAVDVVADPRARYKAHSPADSGWQDRQISLSLTADGRLTTAGAQMTDKSDARIKAIVTIGATVAGGLLVLGASPLAAGAVGIAAAVTTGSSLHHMIEELDLSGYSGTAADEQHEQVQPATPKPEELGINPEFAKECPADCVLLCGYRSALLQLTARHVATAGGGKDMLPATMADVLKHLDAALRSTRAEARLVEARYDIWLKSKEQMNVETIVLELYAHDLPDTDAFIRQLHSGPGDKPPEWWEAVEKLRTMVTIDYLEDNAAVAAQARVAANSVAAGSIVYRPPRSALLKTWTVADGSTISSGLAARLARQDRILVTVPGRELTIAVSTEKKEGTVKVGFDPSGALTTLDVTSNSSAARRAETVAGLPTIVQGALTTGGAIAGTFDAKQRELQRLERELKIAEANAKLKGPADPDPKLTALQDKLAVAELEARLAAAELVRANPSEATIVVRSGG